MVETAAGRYGAAIEEVAVTAGCSNLVAAANRQLIFKRREKPPRPGDHVTYMGRRFW